MSAVYKWTQSHANALLAIWIVVSWLRNSATAVDPGTTLLKPANASRQTVWNSDGFAEGLGRIVVDGKWGFIDTNGKVVIAPQFERVMSFNDGLASAMVGTQWGYIDRTGRLVIAPQYSWEAAFSEGLVCLQLTSKFGYLDRLGKVAIEPRFDYARSFSEGWAAVILNGKPAYIDHKGTIVLRPTVPASDSFEEGLAACWDKTFRKFGFMNRTGKVVIPVQFSSQHNSVSGHWSSQRFSGGRALIIVWNDGVGKWGFIDKAGKIVIQPAFTCARDFDDGVALVGVGGDVGKMKLGFIDLNGNYVINPQFDRAAPFSEGLAAAARDGTNGYIDRSGRFVITLDKADAQHRFCEGYAVVQTHDQAWGYIDRTGNWLWRPRK